MSAAVTPLPEGLILPPPEIRGIVDKTAAFVAKSAQPEVLEERFRVKGKTDSRFAFLTVGDAYYAYYQHRLEAFRAGEVAVAKVDDQVAGNAEEAAADSDGRPTEPPTLEFLVEHPTMNAVDLDILRLTALFTARSGRQFASELAKRENRNYQFDFLRPSHSLFGYFNKLTDQYTKVLIPTKEVQTRLQARSGGLDGEVPDRAHAGRQAVMKAAKERVEWEKWESSRKEEIASAEEAERIAFAEIDWQDFIVVSTVEFTESDKEGLVELPPPMSITEVENMTLSQKKRAAMIMEGREEELDQIEREREAAEEVEMEMDDVEDVVDARVEAKLEKERQRVIEIRTADSTAPMKIRKDYIPMSKRQAKAGPVLTTFGNQQVPVEDFAEHVRIELLDPRWKEEKRLSEANRSAANLLPGGTDVSASIRALAANRPDIFGSGQAGHDEEARRMQEAAAKSKAREKDVWDGHTATKDSVTNRYQTGANLDEQIEALHRAKGLIGVEDGQTPRIGPAVPVVPVSVPLETPTFASGAATISAAPQPNQSSNPSSYYPQNYGQAPNYPPQSYAQPMPSMAAPAPISGLPARPDVAVPGEALPSALPTGVVRSAEEYPDDEPGAKRQRVTRPTDGTYLPEESWLLSHPDPISLRVQLPEYSEKPAWGCDGTEIVLENVPLTLIAGVIRDRIASKIGIPISKQKLSYNGKILANSGTLAGLNFEDGDLITLAIKEKKR